jgi:hypothetical protein
LIEDAQIQDCFKKWAIQASNCLGDTYDACKPFLDKDCSSLDPLVRFVVAQLKISCHLTSESVVLLILNSKVWDADILLRSVLEGTFKLIFLLKGNNESRLIKTKEYWELLPDIARLRKHLRASETLKIVDPQNSLFEWRPIREIMLDDTELATLQKKFSNRERQELSKKWSFTEIARHFSVDSNKRYSGMGALGYDYSLKSHLIHQDGDGVGMVWERYRRSKDSQVAIEIAHAARVISDVCRFGFMRASELLLACKQPEDPVFEISSRYKTLFDDVHSSYEDWFKIEYRPE